MQTLDTIVSEFSMLAGSLQCAMPGVSKVITSHSLVWIHNYIKFYLGNKIKKSNSIKANQKFIKKKKKSIPVSQREKI